MPFVPQSPLPGPIVLVALALSMLATAPHSAAEPVVVTAFDQPLLFVYGEWEGKVAVADGRLPIRGVNGRGGGGCVWLQDLTAHAQRVPALVVRVLPENQAAGIALLLGDRAENLGRWEFTLPAPGGTEGAGQGDDSVMLLPASGGSLAEPDSLTKPGNLDLSNITNWQVTGDWSHKPLGVIVERILLVGEEDDPRVAEVRQARRARLEAERAKAEEELAAERAAVKHTPESPWIERCYTVAPDVLALAIRAREIIPGHIEPYVPQPGDEVRPKEHRADLYRNGVFVAKLVGPKLDTLVFDDQITGDALLEPLAGRTDTWAISSPDDPNYAAPVAPVRVSRKSKPVNWQHGGWGRDSFAMRHIVYLHLPHPLVEGARYTVDCSRINLRETAYTFVHRPRETWSEAVHCCQVGFRPDDPLKRGFLSVWLGTGGAQSYPEDLGFAVLDDATGEEVYRGKVEMSRRASEPEYMWVKEPRNWNYTDVLRMDFSALTRPGTYRLYVDGVGCSHPFRIAQDVWERAFLIQMQGFLNQRSGIELGPPYTKFRKPRDFHPEDGVQVLQSTYSILDGGGEFEVAKHGTEQAVAEGWGGWHDAGDWNPRRMTHLRNNVDILLELAGMFPEYFGRLSWPLPDDQLVPSLLKEMMFEVDCFRRLQLPSGACRHGMETEGDPRDGEVSWKQTMPVYVYAPDAWSSYICASVAARLAWVTGRYDAGLAAIYRESAVRAMEWAEAEWERIRDQPKIKERWEIPDDRNLAAIELYRLTGERRWLDIFMQDTVLKDEKPELFAWGYHVQHHAAFTYATLPDDMTDPVLKARAKAGLVELAERAPAYADGNAWGLTTSDKGRPLFLFFYSVPQAVDLVRAHYLTGDPKYLRGILQACLFPGGANPMNTTFTVGVGADWPHNPLHVDSRITGQPAPLGLTVYGPCDFLHWQGDFVTWPMNLLLSQVNVPGPYEWPVPEAFYDVWIYVAQDEYTVEGFGQNAYVRGYLAARR